jgi:hypothetical protein
MISNELGIPIEDVRNALVMTVRIPQDMRGRFENYVNDALNRARMHDYLADYMEQYGELPPFLGDDEGGPDPYAIGSREEISRVMGRGGQFIPSMTDEQRAMKQQVEEWQEEASARAEQSYRNALRSAKRKQQQIREGTRPEGSLTREEYAALRTELDRRRDEQRRRSLGTDD